MNNKQNSFHNKFAAFVVLVIFAATTDAFTSITLRSLQSKTWKSIGVAKRSDSLAIPHRKNPQRCSNKIRAAWTSEEYKVAQACTGMKPELVIRFSLFAIPGKC